MGVRHGQLTAIDLFAGCGGLSLGLRRARFRVLAAVECDSLAAATYRKNHPRTALLERDIRKLPVSEVMKKLKIDRGELDLLAGCPPCQGFSSVRTLNGKRRAVGANNRLIDEFLRFARVLRPQSVLVENVPALARNWRLSRFKSKLRKLGYSVRVEIRDAQEFGVPQRRRRMILLGTLGSKPTPVPPGTRKRSVRDAISLLPATGASGDRCHDLGETRTASVAAIIRAIPADGGNRSTLGRRLQLPCHRRSDGFKDVYGRMAWDDVSPTITGGCVNPSKGRFLHPSAHRAITLREAALLQGFPRGYRFSLSRGKFATAQLIGNAFPPDFAAAQARHLRNCMREETLRARSD